MNKSVKHLKNVLFFCTSFSGKAGRTEFSLYFIFIGALGFWALDLFININLNDQRILNYFYTCLIILFTFIPFQAASIRRMNDLGIKRSWIILNFIPIVGDFFKIYLCFARRKK